MKNRLAVIVAILALVVIALGGYLTGEIRVLPGATATTPATDPALEQIHRIGGYVVAALTAGLGIWVMNLAGWVTLAVVIAEIFTAGMPVVHAILSPVLISGIAAIVVTTSERWKAGPKPVVSGWGPLKVLGMLTPVLVFLQLCIGAAARHNFMNPISHVLNAFIVIAVILVAGIIVYRQHMEHVSLKTAALALLIISGIQVLLGFTVYLVLLMSEANNLALIITGALHVTNGALTLAASVVLAMEMNRNLIKSSGAG